MANKAILGLLVIGLLVMTAIPAITDAKIDSTNGLVEDFFRAQNDDSAKVSFQVYTDADAAGATAEKVRVYIGDAATQEPIGGVDNIYTIQATQGVQKLDATLKQVKDAISAAKTGGANIKSLAVNTVATYTLLVNKVNADGSNGANEITQQISIVLEPVPAEYSGLNVLPDKVEFADQTGDDEINPGDKVFVEAELKADALYQDIEVRAWIMDETANPKVMLGAEDSVKVGTLGADDEETIKLQLPYEDKLAEVMDTTHKYVVYAEATAKTSKDDSNRWSKQLKTYELKVETEDDALLIRDAKVSESEVEAGKSFVMSARVYNNGEDTQEDVNIKAEIKELGITISKNLRTLHTTEYKDFEGVLGIPAGAAAGNYKLVLTTWSKHADPVSKEYTLAVKGTAGAASLGDLKASETSKDVSADGATYTVTLKNKGTVAMNYSLSVENADWADATLSDSSVKLAAGESKDVSVAVKPKAGQTGSKTFSVVAEANGKEVDSIDFTANIKGGVAMQDTVVEVLQWVFAVIIVIAIILVIVWAATRGNGKKKKDDVYY